MNAKLSSITPPVPKGFAQTPPLVLAWLGTRIILLEERIRELAAGLNNNSIHFNQTQSFDAPFAKKSQKPVVLKKSGVEFDSRCWNPRKWYQGWL